MRKDKCVHFLFAGVAALFFTVHSKTSVADDVVVIPLFTTSITCTAPDEVESEGYCWKDRNLGASRVATSSNDNASFGDHYQWGRPRDGHQNYNPSAATTPVLSLNDVPGHSDFITVSPPSYDWRDPKNDILWQGLGGVNNPCPQGFRLPTKMELETEMLSWTPINAAGALISPLKLVLAGYRVPTNGTYIPQGVSGHYWSSTVSGDKSWCLSIRIDTNGTTMGSTARATGQSVRCIKD